MRLLPLAFILCSTSVAYADSVLDSLPAVSKDGSQFARPVHVQPKGCSGMQSFVELGTVGTPGKPGKSELLLVADECNGNAKTSANVDKVAKAIGSFVRVDAQMSTQGVPTTVQTATLTLDVAASGDSVKIGVHGSQTDQWTVGLEGKVIEVHGAYEGKNAAGDAYVAVLVAVSASDTGKAGRERWVDLWPVGGGDAGDGTPADTGLAFVKALGSGDTEAIQEMLAAPFWKVGLKGTSKKCKRKDSARKARDLGKIAACMTEAPSEAYAKYGTADNVAETDMAEFPDELKKYKKKVARLVKKGAKLVQFKVNQDGYYVLLEMVLLPDEGYRTAAAVLELVEK